MNGSTYHRPVLLEESLRLLALRPGNTVVDATLGGGGHAEAILESIGPDGRLLAFDVDRDAITHATERLARFAPRVEFVQRSFREIETVVSELGWAPVHAVLFDLGVSSHQLDNPERGFRFGEAEAHPELPLDMRMNNALGRDAKDLLAQASVSELTLWFRDYGELKGAARLAREIVETRKRETLHSARDLIAAIERAGVGRGRRHHPATLVFQALRVAVNDELDALREGLVGARNVLAPGARLVVIAYHSLEDRMTKRFFRAENQPCICPPRQPVCTCGKKATLSLPVRRAVRASESEIAANPRARSARLRVAERLPVDEEAA